MCLIYRAFLELQELLLRSVLLKPGTNAADKSSEEQSGGPERGRPPPTPTKMANTSTIGNDGVERGDLIKFYNSGGYLFTLIYANWKFLCWYKTSRRKKDIFGCQQYLILVFMESVQEYAMKFRRQSSLPPLSPLPVLRANPASSPCRKVSENHSLYIRNRQRKIKINICSV